VATHDTPAPGGGGATPTPAAPDPEPTAGPGYGLIRAAVGVVRRREVAHLRMWGRDPARMLNGLMTNDLAALSTGRAVYGAVLTPKGKIIADVRVVARADAESPELWIEADEATAVPLMDQLRKFVPPMYARSAAAELVTLGVYGPASVRLVEELLGGRADPTEDAVTGGTLLDQAVLAIGSGAAGGPPAIPGFDLLVPETIADDVEAELIRRADALGGGASTLGDLEVLRVEAGRPRSGREITDETLPAEAYESIGWMERAVSFTKGCYTGQEVVVRIAHRGHVNRLLRGLLLGDSPPPAYRTGLVDPASGRTVGWVATSVRSPAHDQTIALAYVRREVEPRARLVLEGSDPPAEAIVSTLPFETVPLRPDSR
jgi:tRNA-modifying protein YgfZ